MNDHSAPYPSSPPQQDTAYMKNAAVKNKKQKKYDEVEKKKKKSRCSVVKRDTYDDIDIYIYIFVCL